MRTPISLKSILDKTENKNPHTYIIAEIGINHEGSFEKCIKLVDMAFEAGANAVKLQTIDPDLNYSRETDSYNIFSKAKLTFEETAGVFGYARKIGIEPFTTVGDLKTLSEIKKLRPICYKISSGLLTCHPIIAEISKLETPIILSTGMSGVNEIRSALNVLDFRSKDMTAILHCVSLYPTKNKDLHLSQIQHLQTIFNCVVGFSDHSGNALIAPLAVMAGARIIETHLTFDKNRPDFDHKVSLDPKGFSRMVKKIREFEILLGISGDARDQKIVNVESQMSRYLAAIKPMRSGELISLENTGFIRFSDVNGLIPAKFFDQFCGKKVSKNLLASQPITVEDISNA